MNKKRENEKIHEMSLDITPYVAGRLKESNITVERIVSLHLMGRLDLLKDIDGITDGAVYKIRTALTPDNPGYQEYRWLYHLALKAFFGDYGLNTLLYAEPGSKPLIDRVILATAGTEEVAREYFKQKLNPREREIIEDVFRKGLEMPHIARKYQITEVRVRQIYHKAMDKLSDEDKGIADDLLHLVFDNPEKEEQHGRRGKHGKHGKHGKTMVATGKKAKYA